MCHTLKNLIWPLTYAIRFWWHAKHALVKNNHEDRQIIFPSHIKPTNSKVLFVELNKSGHEKICFLHV